MVTVVDAPPLEVEDEIIDLEAYAKEGKKPPRARGYKIKVNGNKFTIEEPEPTRETILETAGLTPTDRWSLRLKGKGGTPRLIEPGERVNLMEPGIEKFKALPRDQMEGQHGLAAAI